MTDVTPVGPTDPIADGPTQATAIVTTPTTVAPLTTAAGAVFVVQVTGTDTQNYQPVNAASWNRTADGGLDIYDLKGNLVAGFLPGQAKMVQLIVAPPPPVNTDA